MTELKPTRDMTIRDQLRQWYRNIPNLYHGALLSTNIIRRLDARQELLRKILMEQVTPEQKDG